MNGICHELHLWANSRPQLCFPFDSSKIPENGIYILFERGELAHGGQRIVRIGTHRGENQLRSRLNQHFVKENKDRSIFRKNIGRALLSKSNDPFAEQWERDLTTRAGKLRYGSVFDQNKQKQIEGDVSQYIRRAFSFITFEVKTEAERLRLEAKLISAVSLCEECPPSPEWLGRRSPKEKIRESGLWQVNELYKEPLCAEGLVALRTCP